jgi:hypothetical protein
MPAQPDQVGCDAGNSAAGNPGWFAERGVPAEQRRVLAGHSAQGTTARNYEHLSPNYLRNAIEEVDAFFLEPKKHTTALNSPPIRT